MYNFKKNNQKGFTLAELLIVVAIIAVLIAIMIPTFGGQLEKARESADLANLRAAYAEATIVYLNDQDSATATKQTSTDTTKTVILVSNVKFSQTDGEWSTGATDGLPFGFDPGVKAPKKSNSTVTFTFVNATGVATVSGYGPTT
ncbi:MAG: type II secretion system protein [Ruminococcaceae bacterium]|jgi:prepilin-type N-terminal cleavage/methylation domain-containing protein|nr:type II secretion system protein [Oscillospiraceae bacterium]